MSEPDDFVHLHVHSEFSLLDGLSRSSELTQRAAELGMSALAVTDHGAMYGAIEFYTAATAAGIKPIIGIEQYVAPRRMTDKEGKLDADYYHMLLLARNEVGYRNLLALTTAAHLDGYYYKPRIDKELLARHADGLIGTSACLGGEVLQKLARGDERGARQAADEYRSILGPENFFIEVQDHGVGEQQRLHPQLVELARDMNIPLIATNDTHYTIPEQHEAHDLLLCIGTGSNLDTPGRMRFETNEFYLKSPQQMRGLFRGELPDAMDNTLRVAEMVDLKLEFEHLRLPHFPVPDGETAGSWLRSECERGLQDRYASRLTDEVRHRLDYELGIIDRMGYSAYFLIVADFTRFAREQGIMTTCRGSAPGSIVTYSLGITPVDPLQYGLPFERFLNPDRVTMPDIDIDFQDSRRDEVIEYVTRKYGDDRVAQIITFGTLGAKAAIRDSGRAMGLTYAEADRVAKAVPNELNISLERAVETSPQLRELMAGDDRVDKLIGVAKQLEGVARHASTHAAGIVISREPLTEIMPLQRATDGKTTMTQFEMHACEALGLLKFDFLGLINLTILADAVQLVKTHRNIPIDVDHLPLDDAKTFNLLGHGDTMGVFQLEGSGMRRYVKELKPTEVRDLAAMVALFRPGPMANIPSYIRRKHGEEAVTYLHPSLEPALRDTYGIFVYQEDIMTAAIAMADYTGPEADNLCYAIRKKKESVLREHEAKFKAGAKKKGISAGIVDQVFAAFEPFARYGFNKAHATCYGLIAYQTAYLKANFPVEFMTAVLNGFRERSEKVAAVIAECRRLEIDVRPPDVQKSSAQFTVEVDATGVPEAIRFGLAAVKNVGEGVVRDLVAAREAGGGFKSLRDLCERASQGLANKRVLESLIQVQALSSLGNDESLLDALDGTLAATSTANRDTVSYSLDEMFAGWDQDGLTNQHRFLDHLSEAPDQVKGRREKELLGLYFRHHPLDGIAQAIRDYTSEDIADLSEAAERAVVTVGGIVASSRRIVTKAGSMMLVPILEDLTGSIEVVVFPKVYQQTANSWEEGSVVLVTGRIDRRDETPQVLCEAVWRWDDVVRMEPAAFVAMRDQFTSGRRAGRGALAARATRQGMAEQRENVSSTPSVGLSQAIAVQPDAPMGVAVAEANSRMAISADSSDKPPAPAGAIPLRGTAFPGEAVLIAFPPTITGNRLLEAVSSANQLLSDHPGIWPAVIEVPGVGGAVRIKQRVHWNSRLEHEVRRVVGIEDLAVTRVPYSGNADGTDERPLVTHPRPDTLWDAEEHTTAKHRLLRSYLDAWIPILGWRNEELCLIDGFAGPGRYVGGQEGSPIVMLRAFLEHRRRTNIRARLQYIFIEERPDRVEHLRSELARMDIPGQVKVSVHCGKFHEVLPSALVSLYGDERPPTMAFVDPFGYAADHLDLTSEILLEPRCEALVYVPLPFIARFVEHAPIAEALRKLYGDDSWVPARDLRGRDRLLFLHDRFRETLRRSATFVRSFEMVGPAGTGYHLFFATSHQKGLQRMKEAMWKVDPTSGSRFRDSTHPGQSVLFESEPAFVELAGMFRQRWPEGRFRVEDAESYALLETPYLTSHVRRALKVAEDEMGLRVRRPVGARSGQYPVGTELTFRDE